MLSKARTTIASVTAVALLATTSMAVVPAAIAASPGVYNGAPVILAENRKGNWHGGFSKRRHGYNNYWYGNNYRRGYGYNNNLGLGLFAFGAGAILGSMIAQPQYYYGNNWDAYCASKYRSYKRSTGTYTGYDGLQHRCR
jgi:hypothetical protein